MKLISLYIENFGTLSHYALDFEAGLTTINQPNGFGKTTLAEFIRAMFYGFPRKVKTLDKSKRQKYAPWNGGQYGGNLVFEYEGQRYRMERTFGTTPKGDTFAVIDLGNNRKTDRFSPEIGTQLFELDSESFERSTYLPQMAESGPLATAAIQAKLSDLVENSSDMANFDKAIAMLKSGRSALIPYRGSGGSVAEASGMVAQLQLEVDRLCRQQEQLYDGQKQAAQAEQEIESLQADLARVREELTAASAAVADRMRQRQYEELRNRCRQAQARQAQYQTKYPQGLPQEQVLQQAEDTADRLAVLLAQDITTQADLQAQSLLQANPALEAHLPTDAELAHYRRNCEEYDALQAKIAEQQNAAAELVQEERQLLQISEHESHAGNQTTAIAALVTGAVGVAAGALLMIWQKFLYGGIGLGVGAGVLVVGILLLLGRRKRHSTRQSDWIARRKLLDERITASQQEIAVLNQAAETSRAEVAAFLAEYSIEVPPQHFLAELTKLEHRTAQFMQAKEQVLQWQQRKERHEAQLETYRRQMQMLFAQYGLTMEQDARRQLRMMREDLHDARAAQTQVQELLGQLAQMEETYGEVLSADLGTAADLDLLKQQEQQLRTALTEATSRMLLQRQLVQQLHQQIEKIPQLQDQLENWKQKKEKDREQAKIIDDTMEFLQRAKERLSTSYLGTVQSHFCHYLQQLEDDTDGKYFIDTDLQVRLERMGQARELAYFSAGQTDLVMLCMRLALVDALFKEQEIFVILDDPFVNLDDAHTAQALKLLGKLASERQIIYLTCHSSRAI